MYAVWQWSNVIAKCSSRLRFKTSMFKTQWALRKPIWAPRARLRCSKSCCESVPTAQMTHKHAWERNKRAYNAQKCCLGRQRSRFWHTTILSSDRRARCMRAAGVSQWRSCPRMLPGKQTWKHLVKTSTVTEHWTRSLNWSSFSIHPKACAFVLSGTLPGPLKSRALVREQWWHRDQLLMSVLPVSQLHATAVPPMAQLLS